MMHSMVQDRHEGKYSKRGMLKSQNMGTGTGVTAAWRSLGYAAHNRRTCN